MVEAHGGLHQRIEAAAAGPRALRAIGRERDADDAGPQRRELRRPEAQRLEAAGPVTLHEHMRLAGQPAQRRLSFVGAQVDMRRQLAAAGVGDGLDVGQPRRVDQHHVGPVGRERAPADRAGQDAREVEHAQARERPLVLAQRR